MKPLIFMFCAFLALSIPIENNASAESKPTLRFDKDFLKYAPNPDLHTNQNRSREVIKYREIKPSEGDRKPYFFIKDSNGNLVIIDATTYEKIISYVLPELNDISTIVGDSLYRIAAGTGRILSTPVANIIEDPNNVTWAHVGSFPSSDYLASHSVAVDGSLIYFITSSDVIYVYDTISRLVTKAGIFDLTDGYASLIVVQKILYIFIQYRLYSFDGTTIRTLPTTPDRRYASKLFQMGNNVCLAGGNDTDVYPDPVHCYNPITEEWNIASYLNEARWFSGIAATESKTVMFGGGAWFAQPNISIVYLDSVEVLDHKTNIWSYAPSPFTVESKTFLQAFLFYY